MSKWLYGDSWEKYPIEAGEIWKDPVSESVVEVADLRGPSHIINPVDMIYSDPPWSQGNANSFVTKAGMESYLKSFNEFMDALFSRLCMFSPKVCYLEIGKQHKDDFKARLSVYPYVQEWEIRYYKKHPCYLLRGGFDSIDADFTGLDDEKTPTLAIESDNPRTVADICTGRGLTLLAAHKHKATFYGSELNKRRLAVAIDRAAKIGVYYEKCDIHQTS